MENCLVYNWFQFQWNNDYSHFDKHAIHKKSDTRQQFQSNINTDLQLCALRNIYHEQTFKTALNYVFCTWNIEPTIIRFGWCCSELRSNRLTVAVITRGFFLFDKIKLKIFRLIFSPTFFNYTSKVHQFDANLKKAES